MKREGINIVLNAAIFSILGIAAYVLLANSANLPMDVNRVLSYGWGYLFFVVAFNLIGFAIIQSSNWIGRYMMQRWRMTLLYSYVAVILLLINYGLLVAAKMLVGVQEPYIFPNGGWRVLVLLWLVDLIIVGLLIVNRATVEAMTAQKEAARLQEEAARLQEENDKARYAALQSQLNPHFLFNSLNTLIAEIEYNPRNAILFTRSLSGAYRYVLQAQHKTLVTLQEELEFMHSYIFLHRVRLGDNIRVDCRIEERYLDAKLPPLTLQLLMENVIKHNSITAATPMQINVSVADGMLWVSNSIRLKKSVDSTGTGLQNLGKRSLLTTGRNLMIESSDEIFTVKIPMIYE